MKPKPAIDEVQKRAEWELLVFNFWVNIFYLINNIYVIYIDLKYKGYIRITLDLGALGEAILLLISMIAEYGLMMGMIVLLIICR